MIGWLIGNVLQVVPDLFISDEEAKRAAKAGLWATIAAVSAPIDPASSAGASVIAGTNLAAAASSDEDVTSTIDTAGSVLSSTVNASPLELAKVMSFGVAGATAGGSSQEKSGAARGFGLGAQLGAGSLDQMMAKGAGAVAGGSAAVAIGDDDDGFRRFEVGARLGIGVASDVSGLAHPSKDARAASAAALAGRAGGLALAGAMRDSRKDGSLIDSIETGSKIGGAAASVATSLASSAGPMKSLEATASLGSAILGALPVEDVESSVGRFRRDEELRSARRRAKEEEQKRAALREVLENSAALAVEIGS
jgi:hypothetical protein